MKGKTNSICYNDVETTKFLDRFLDCLHTIFFNAGVLFGSVR
jgi:hypothetical protein